MLNGIVPEKLLLKRSRLVITGAMKICHVGCGMGPESSLFERSNPVKLEQFSTPLGNWPLRPISESRRFKTLFSSGCQHSTPVNLQMNPSVLLLKSHEEFKYL